MVEDNPQDLVHDVAAEAVFGGHPLGRPVIGRAEVISSRLPARASRTTTRAAYCARNIVVAAAGNVDHERVLARSSRERRSTAAAPRRTREAARRAPPARASAS